MVLFSKTTSPSVEWVDLDTGEVVGSVALGTTGWPTEVVVDGTEAMLMQVAAAGRSHDRYICTGLDLTGRRPGRVAFERAFDDARMWPGSRPGTALFGLLGAHEPDSAFEMPMGWQPATAREPIAFTGFRLAAAGPGPDRVTVARIEPANKLQVLGVPGGTPLAEADLGALDAERLIATRSRRYVYAAMTDHHGDWAIGRMGAELKVERWLSSDGDSGLLASALDQDAVFVWHGAEDGPAVVRLIREPDAKAVDAWRLPTELADSPWAAASMPGGGLVLYFEEDRWHERPGGNVAVLSPGGGVKQIKDCADADKMTVTRLTAADWAVVRARLARAKLPPVVPPTVWPERLAAAAAPSAGDDAETRASLAKWLHPAWLPTDQPLRVSTWTDLGGGPLQRVVRQTVTSRRGVEPPWRFDCVWLLVKEQTGWTLDGGWLEPRDAWPQALHLDDDDEVRRDDLVAHMAMDHVPNWRSSRDGGEPGPGSFGGSSRPSGGGSFGAPSSRPSTGGSFGSLSGAAPGGDSWSSPMTGPSVEVALGGAAKAPVSACEMNGRAIAMWVERGQPLRIWVRVFALPEPLVLPYAARPQSLPLWPGLRGTRSGGHSEPRGGSAAPPH